MTTTNTATIEEETTTTTRTTGRTTTTRIRNIADIKIGNRFRKDLGDIDGLAGTIKDVGLLQPPSITKDNELILGARRIEAYKRLGLSEIPVNVIPIDDIVRGELIENEARKAFTVSERVAILEYIESKRLGHRQKKGVNLPPLSFQEQEKGKKSRDIVANYTGIKPGQLSRDKKLVHMVKANPTKQNMAILEQVDKGVMKPSKAIKRIEKYQKRLELQQLYNNDNNSGELLPDGNANLKLKLLLGDFREKLKAVPDNSVDIIITDPPYTKDCLPVYADLAKESARLLPVSLLTIIPQYARPTVYNYLEQETDLNYFWEFCIKHSGSISKMWTQEIWPHWKPMTWYVKGQQKPDYMASNICDLIESDEPDKTGHDWAQSPKEAEYIISQLTVENQIVLDPFMGIGTFGLAALKLNRKFMGIEINEDTFNIAKINFAKAITEEGIILN